MRTLPDTVTTLVLPSGSVRVDEHGYITDPELWTPEFAAHAAKSEGVRLSPEHFEIIDFIRTWNDEHGVMPDVRFVLGYLSDRDSVDKKGAKDRLFELFPQGYVKQACKIAGMKQPRAWSTG